MPCTNSFSCNLVCRWEKYDAKGLTEKGAHKYGQLNEQSWWEKWGENYDGRGYVLKWSVCLAAFCICKVPIIMVILYG